MHGSQNVASPRRQVFDTATHLAPDVVRCSVRQHLLGINGSAKRQPAAELALQPRGVAHIPGGDMDRVEHINPGLNQIIEQRVDVTVRMVEDPGPGSAA